MTCLQFMNNLVAQNERRKLNLWVELFDSPADASYPGPSLDRERERAIGREMEPRTGFHAMEESLNQEHERDGLPDAIRNFKDGLLAHLNRLDERQPLGFFPQSQHISDEKHQRDSPFLLYIGKVGMEVKKELIAQGKPAGASEITAQCRARWEAMSKEEQKVSLFTVSSRSSFR
jgi:palmitoyltransferase